MAHHWTPMELLERQPDCWFVVDGGRKIAILKEVKISPNPRVLIRSVTYDPDPEARVLIGYFPDLPHAALVTYYEWLRANGRVPRGYE